MDIPSPAVTERVIDDQLPALGASPELRHRLHELFQAYERARYAPRQHAGLLPKLLPKIRQSLLELRALPQPQATKGKPS